MPEDYAGNCPFAFWRAEGPYERSVKNGSEDCNINGVFPSVGTLANLERY